MDYNTFNTALAKRLQSLKKDLGALNVRQGYRGTGSKAHRRQIWVELPHAERGIDLWLDTGIIGLGGVCFTNYGKVLCGREADGTERSIDEVYAEIVEKLRPLTKPREIGPVLGGEPRTRQ